MNINKYLAQKYENLYLITFLFLTATHAKCHHHSYPPLHNAAYFGNIIYCQELISNGADVNATPDNSQESALHIAAEEGYTKIGPSCKVDLGIR